MDAAKSVTAVFSLAPGIRPIVPDPFPYDMLYPSPGAPNINAQGICFTWPTAEYAETYGLLVSSDPDMRDPREIDVRGLAESAECSVVSLKASIGSFLAKTKPPPAPVVGSLIATATFQSTPFSYLAQGLSPGATYYWQVIASNVNGSSHYPVFSFFTNFETEEVDLGSPQLLATGNHQWFSIPLVLDDPEPTAALTDDFGEYNLTWKLFRLNSGFQSIEYVPPSNQQPGNMQLEPGLGNSIQLLQPAQSTNLTITAQGRTVDLENDFVITVPPGYFHLGCPFPFRINWRDVKVGKGDDDPVSVGDVTVGLQSDPTRLWLTPPQTYDPISGAYPVSEALEPWIGYTLENRSGEELKLYVPALVAGPPGLGR
jgi:hypothetical protein